jgi:hypothetical protein
VYWMIAVINVLLRFCWTLSFVPPRYLSEAGVLTDNFSGDVATVLSPIIAFAEVCRRTLWGLIRFEYEAIKVGGTAASCSSTHIKSEEEQGMELVPMKVQNDDSALAIDSRISSSTEMSSMSEVNILVELCTYATVFAALGVVAAAHRGTL